MVNVSSKQISLRTARAIGKVLCSPETVERIKNNTLPKGNLFDIAKAAGLLASKNTSHLIPHCHPVSIDGMEIDYEILDGSQGENGVLINVEGRSIGRTGIEMEVLTAVSVCALTIYDLLKPIDKNLEMTSFKLTEKTGGKSDQKKEVKGTNKVAILVCSDSTAAGTRKDKSGLIIKDMVSQYKAEVVDYKIVPDKADIIQKQIMDWVEADIHFIFTTGGTGLGPKDHTVDAVKEIIERDAPGISEAVRVFGGMRSPFAMLSRSVAGSIKNTLIITLPGSSDGAREGLEAVLPGVFHSRKMLMGGGHD
ncbi:MAG: bifunctional molybdenum cofactor biosynthesis protein MoaC/MoaB [Spirochaetota bacterium]|nr:bifunctional molybdenum cofactor biosynthesis protein MoaC/MoaB [Spirochaetota bacterium]